MAWQHLDVKHVALVTTHTAKHAVRGGTGIVYLLLTLGCGLGIANLTVSGLDRARIELKQRGTELTGAQLLEEISKNEAFRAFLRPWLVTKPGEDATAEEIRSANKESTLWLNYLLEGRPALLSILIFAMLLLLPFLIGVGCFNLFSGDVQSRGIRYHLLRTERINIFLGRYLGSVLYSLFVVTLLVLVVVVYIGSSFDIYSWSDLIQWGGMGLFSLVCLTLPFVAFCALISTCVDAPFGSLTLIHIVMGGVPLFALLGKVPHVDPRFFDWTVHLLPWGIMKYLVHYEFTYVLLAGVACVLYALVFLLLGFLRFEKRDM